MVVRFFMRGLVIKDVGRRPSISFASFESRPLVDTELRVRVLAAGVNRADLLQARGLYPPPPGASKVLGLECAGEVLEVGGAVKGWQKGDRSMALLAGGGYADEVVVDSACAMKVPQNWSWSEAAAFPEVHLTVHLNLFVLAGLERGDFCLVHGGGSGIGTAAIKMTKAAGIKIAVTAGSDERCSRCVELGAHLAINYRKAVFSDEVKNWTNGAGIDAVLDSIGAPYLDSNIQCLKNNGHLLLIGLMGGAKGRVDLTPILGRRLNVIGSTLRSRPLLEKRKLVVSFLDRFKDRIFNGDLCPIVERVLPISEVEEAHRVMRSGEHFGKIILSID